MKRRNAHLTVAHSIVAVGPVEVCHATSSAIQKLRQFISMEMCLTRQCLAMTTSLFQYSVGTRNNMLLFCYQNQDIKLANRPSENVSQFKYSVGTVTNQNIIQEEIKRRLNSVMLATIQSTTFCLLICCQITYKIKYT
jgi:hypothetical protein